MQTIPIFFTFDRYYVVPACVAIYSLLKNASKEYFYQLFVLHTDLNERHFSKIKKVVSGYENAAIEFKNVASYDVDAIQHGKSHFSKEIYYKLIVADLFPQYDRILCSDVDVVFERDIAPSYFLFQGDDFYFAGVGEFLESNRMKAYGSDFSSEELEILKKEIGAGYMLINLDAIRKKGIQEKLVDFYIKNYDRLRLPEQDCITLVCRQGIKYLPLEYVVCNTFYSTPNSELRFFKEYAEYRSDEESKSLFMKALNEPIQIHYVGAEKPWNSFSVARSERWFHYLKLSGCTAFYIRELPRIVRKKISRYSLKRRIRKCILNLRKHFQA